jgi:uncharacterized protein YdhG (YjbR/CyaY superfamily)
VATTSGDRSQQFPAIERKHGQPVQHWFDLLAEHGDAKYDEQMALLREGHGFSQAHANAVVMTHRGSTTTRRFADPEAFFDSLDPVKATTARAIFAAIQKNVNGLELVTAWNQPMLRNGSGYLFGLSAASKHLTLSPWSGDVIEQFAERLTGLKVNKKTFIVPVDWKVDAGLLRDMVKARIAELG